MLFLCTKAGEEMSTIDSLDIQIKSSADTANQAINSLIQSLGKLQKALNIDTSKLSGIGKFVDFSGISKAAKSAGAQMDGVAKSANSASSSMKNISKTLSQIERQYKELGKGFQFKGSASAIEKQVEKYSNMLERVKVKKQELEMSGKTEGKQYESAVKDVIKYQNIVKSLKDQLQSLKSAQPTMEIKSAGIEIAGKKIIEYKKELNDLKNDMKSLSDAYGGFSNLPKGMLDSPIEDLKISVEELKKSFPGATEVISAFEKELQRLKEYSSRLTREPTKLNADTSGLDKVNEKVSELKQKYEKAGMDFKFTGNFEQLKSEIEKVYSELNRLKEKENKMVSGGQVDTSGFERLQERLARVGNKYAILDALRDRTEEFNQSLSKLKVPPVQEENLKKLQDTLRKTEEETERLKTKLANAITVGRIMPNVDDSGFRKLTEQITMSEKQAEALRKKIQEIGEGAKGTGFLDKLKTALSNISSQSNRTSSSTDTLTKKIKNLASSMSGLSASAGKAILGIKSFARQALGAMGIYLGIYGAIRGIKSAIDISSQLTEVQNVVDTTFGDMAYKVEEFAETSIEQFGMAKLSAKQYASRFQSMGTAMGIDKSSIESANAFLKEQTSGYIEMSDSMADVSLNLTRLTADMASLYNVDQSKVAESLAAIFTGQTRPLRTYGLDLTQATLQEWAMKQGLDADIQSMSQAEKTMLRYQYVLANTTNAQGDFARTANTWANQIRILKEQFKELGSVIGKGLISAFKPFIQTLNKVMVKVIVFAETVLNALGTIFGWQIEISQGGLTDDLEDSEDYTDDLASGAGNAADGYKDAAENAKKLKDIVLGIDELNINAPDDDTGDANGSSGSPSGSGGTGGIGAGSGGLTTNIVASGKLLEAYKSSIDTLYKLGEYIRDTLIGVMEGIDWDSVYEKARGFGKGLADFLNGLLAYDGEGRTLFGTIGKTLANTLNTVVYSALSFGQTFDFRQLGVNVADGINNAFRNFDFKALAETLNTWVDGLWDFIGGFLEKIDPRDIFKGIKDFLGTLELDTITVIVGAIAWKLGAGNLIKGALITLLTKNPIALSISAAVKEVGLIGVGEAFLIALKSSLAGIGGSITSTISAALGVSGGAAAAVFAGIIAAVVAVGLAIKDLWDTSESFRKSVSEMWEKITDAFAEAKAMIWDNTLLPLWESLKEFVEAIKEFWKEIYDSYESSGLKSAFEGIVTFFGDILVDNIANAIKFIATVFETVGGVANGLIEILTGIIEIANGIFSGDWSEVWKGVKDVVKGAFDSIVSVLSGAWEIIKIIFSPVIDFFSENFVGAYDSIKSAFSFIGTWFQEKYKDVTGAFKSVKQYFKDAFQGAYDAVKKIWDGIGKYFKGIANDIIAPIGEAVNGVIGGINWVLERVGSKTRLSLWDVPKFATGTGGLPRDTIGMVNDQPGSTYKELIVPPNGKPFIPDGRNVVLPMEKGTKIMPAKQTKAFMESVGMNGIPKFAGGIGSFFGGIWESVTSFTGEIWDYLSNPSKIVQIAIDKFTDASGWNGTFGRIASGAVSTVFDSVVEYVKKLFDSSGGAGIEKAVQWAIGIAHDDSHGYDQGNRWGNPDYDCSALVISAFEQAGIKMKSGGASYTGNMYGVAKNLGFADVTSSVNLGNAGGMKRGDILLNRKNHTAIYIGNGQVVQASSNENGGIRGGTPGDQTGREIWVTSYYNYPWDDVLRYVKAYKNGIGKIKISDLVPGYAVGGFPEDGLFMANHNELVGKFLNGRTAVANNEQITRGIEEATYRGYMRAHAETNETALLEEIRDAIREGRSISIDGREIVRAYDSRKARNGYSFA